MSGDFIKTLQHTPPPPPQYTEYDEFICDSLPNYKPSSNIYTIAYKKTELVSPFHVAKTRCWKPVIVNLNSTQINFYSFQCSRIESFIDFFFKKADLNVEEQYAKEQQHLVDVDDELDAWGGSASSGSGSTGVKNLLKTTSNLLNSKFDDRVVRSKTKSLLEIFNIIANIFKITEHESNILTKLVFGDSQDVFEEEISSIVGNLESSYTLQSATVGKASDYKKKNFVLRFRIELDQLLVKFVNLQKLVDWYSLVSNAVQISLPIEQRYIERSKTIPRRIARRRMASEFFNVLDQTSYRPRRGSDTSLDSHYNFLFSDLRSGEAENENENIDLNKNNYYPINIIESMDFYSKNLKNFNFFRPNFRRFRQASQDSSFSTGNLEQRRFSNMSEETNGSSESRLSLGSSACTEQSSIETSNSNSDTAFADTGVDYDHINECELFDIMYGYKCIKSLKTSDKWADCFVVLSSRDTEGKDDDNDVEEYEKVKAEHMYSKKKNFFNKLRRSSRSGEHESPSLSKYGIQLFYSAFTKQSATEVLSENDLETYEEFEALEELNAEFFKKVLNSAEAVKPEVQTSTKKLIFVDSYSIIKFLKYFKAHKLAFLKDTNANEKDILKGSNSDDSFCKKFMLVEDGLVGWF